MLQNQKCKLCRREGKKLFLKGMRCDSAKCSFTRRSYAPGSNGKKMNMKFSDYAIQLRAKQAAKRIYKINENTLKRYFDKATKSKKSTGEKLLQLLTLRLDNVVYELGLAKSRNQARQLVKHGHILVNKKRVDIPSYQLKAKDKIEVAKNKQPLIENSKKPNNIANWISLSKSKMQGELVSIPNISDITTDIDVDLIVEFYSR